MYKPDLLSDMMIKQFEVSDPNTLGTDHNLRMVWPIRLMELAHQTRKLSNALLVLINLEQVQHFLQENDPKALEQCLEALNIVAK